MNIKPHIRSHNIGRPINRRTQRRITVYRIKPHIQPSLIAIMVLIHSIFSLCWKFVRRNLIANACYHIAMLLQSNSLSTDVRNNLRCQNSASIAAIIQFFSHIYIPRASDTIAIFNFCIPHIRTEKNTADLKTCLS